MEHRAATADGPLATDGFEFIEYTAPDSYALATLFERMGFSAVARHRSKDVVLFREGGINFIINHEPHSFARAFARIHGASVCAFAIRVRDVRAALQRAIERGAKPYYTPVGPQELEIPAIRGIGGSLIYFVECDGERSIYDVDFVALDNIARHTQAELEELYFHGDLSEDAFIRHGNEMLEAVAAFWDGLEVERRKLELPR
jgi:4-hydroxyphenylpyruvate dioxygenase